MGKIKLVIILFITCAFFCGCRRMSSKHITLFIPDNNNISVFNNGTSHGENAAIASGGHTDPNSTVGAKLE